MQRTFAPRWTWTPCKLPFGRLLWSWWHICGFWWRLHLEQRFKNTLGGSPVYREAIGNYQAIAVALDILVFCIPSYWEPLTVNPLPLSKGKPTTQSEINDQIKPGITSIEKHQFVAAGWWQPDAARTGDLNVHWIDSHITSPMNRNIASNISNIFQNHRRQAPHGNLLISVISQFLQLGLTFLWPLLAQSFAVGLQFRSDCAVSSVVAAQGRLVIPLKLWNSWIFQANNNINHVHSMN